MYLPTRHRQTDSAAMRALVERHALGMLVTLEDGLPVADHIPFEFVDSG